MHIGNVAFHTDLGMFRRTLNRDNGGTYQTIGKVRYQDAMGRRLSSR